MAIIFSVKVGSLGESLTLAPERFDPRRNIEVKSGTRLGDLLSISTENVPPTYEKGEQFALILDTTHAYEGYPVFRHGPVPLSQMGSAKRMLRPGDVLISRLRPYLRQIALIGEDLFSIKPGGNLVLASTEFYVLRANSNSANRAEVQNPAGYIPYLLSDTAQSALSAGQEGGHHPRFSRELLESLTVPPGVIIQSHEVAQTILQNYVQLRECFTQTKALVDQANKAFNPE